MEFVVAIVALIIGGQLITNWIRAKNGYTPNVDWLMGDGLTSDDENSEKRLKKGRQIELLSNENADLKGKIVRLEERVAVLERIATDRSTTLAAEIEALR
jgi:hypothetical protein